MAIKQAEHLAWFSFLLDGTLEPIQRNNGTSLGCHRIYLVRNQFRRSARYDSVGDQADSCVTSFNLLLNYKAKRNEELHAKFPIES